MKNWKALALHYGTAARPRADLSLEAIDHHDVIGQIDYFVWIIRRADRLVLIDTGFSKEEGEARGRTMIVDPVEALRLLGIEAADITDVVITHLHYDHAGNLNAFPNAVFHLQEKEMIYGTGRCMCHPRMRRPFAAEAVVDAVRLVFAGKVQFHRGDVELEPGLSLHLIGGHSKGLQVVRLEDEGHVHVFASDALHFASYMQESDMFPLFADYAEVLDGYSTLKRLAGRQGRIIPGHDPLMLAELPVLDEHYHFARFIC
ncbi:N-acyl homoserine lactonase family protein [Rhizobium laguerreae]|uniref:N-acyl homoserine lactonase family protein n=1 Tax=Rhizobium laguerreae TaxID=1076926 RepID=UPI001C92171B|nr:N-acyl homoserine lactonase family protein [Rhizobium laguerreae]MBY3468706.1 N-acyl homoserine lactonase family protein [Rhizobium laguerreae]